MASARVVGTVGSHAADLLIVRDLVEQMWQHRGIPRVATRDLDGSDFQCSLVDTDVDLAPDTPFAAAMLAGVPFAFTLDLDPCAVHCPAVAACSNERVQQVQRAFRAAIRDVDRKRPLSSADGAEVRHGPVQPRQPQETFHKPSRLAKRHPEKHLHGQASLDRGITEGPRPAPLAGGFGIPVHLRIEPDRQ